MPVPLRKDRTSPSRSPEAILFNPDPAAYLPHCAPFLFLDRITSLDPGVTAEAILNCSGGSPGYPLFLCVEALAQLGGIAAGKEEGGGGILAAIDRAELRANPQPGECLTASVTILKAFGPLNLVHGTVAAGGEVIADVTMTLRVGSIAP